MTVPSAKDLGISAAHRRAIMRARGESRASIIESRYAR